MIKGASETESNLIRKQNSGSISLGKRTRLGDKKNRGAELVKPTTTAPTMGLVEQLGRVGRKTVPVGSSKGCGDLGQWAEFNGLFQLDISMGKFTAWPKDEFIHGCG